MHDVAEALVDSAEIRLIDPSATIHPLSVVGDVTIGPRTRVWQFASVIRGTILGADCSVASGALLDGPKFGDRTIVCQNVAMGPGFVIGDDCFIGPNVTFCNDAWPRADKDGFDIDALRNGYVTIVMEDGASIGANAVVLPGVRIGAGAMIAAGAVVDRDVPAGALWMREGGVAHGLARRRQRRMREAR